MYAFKYTYTDASHNNKEETMGSGGNDMGRNHM